MSIKRYSRSPRGITILEVIVAVYVLSLTAVTAATVLVSSLQTERISRERMIAVYLASEGRDALQNIIDSNILKYPANTSECWNFWENPEEAAGTDASFITCDPSIPNTLPDKTYFIYHYGRSDLDSEPVSSIPYTYKSFLTKASKQSDLTSLDPKDSDFAAFDEYKLQYHDLVPSVDGKDADGTTMNDRDQSVYGSNAGTTFETKPTTYYRQLYLEYIDSDANGQNDALHATSRVLWFEKGRKHEVKESLIIDIP